MADASAGSPTIQSGRITAMNRRRCEECEEEDRPGTWYCAGCSQAYCDLCWNSRKAHRRNEHQKVYSARYEHFEDILAPRWNDYERERCHEEDISSLWFSISAGSTGEAGTNANGPGQHSNLQFLPLPRFATLLDEHRQEFGTDRTYYPRLVSFIGATGSGKSTLIRMLLEQPWLTTDHLTGDFAGQRPVVGRQEASVPTSGDVHLYRKMYSHPHAQQTGEISSQGAIISPLLYADCEGFGGGPTDPAGSFAAHEARTGRPDDNDDANTQPRRKVFRSLMNFLKSLCSTELIMDPSVKTRDNAVQKLFPRLLYNFSDVIVFVLHEGERRQMQDAFLKILQWAQASATSALNRPALPCLIVAINQAHDGSTWDPETVAEKIWDEHRTTFEGNEMIRDICLKLMNRGIRIGSLKELLSQSYANIKFINIPHGSLRSHLSDQLVTLSKMIDSSSQVTREKKEAAKMMLNSKDQALFFTLAFKHYISEDADRPFNFIEKLLSMKPMAVSLSNNFCCLLSMVINALPENERNAQTLLARAGPALASAIALDAARHFQNLPGLMRTVYQGFLLTSETQTRQSSKSSRSYEDCVSAAMDLFFGDRICGYVTKNHKCVIVLRTHAKHPHMDADGEVIGPGAFVDDMNLVDDLKCYWQQSMIRHIEDVGNAIKRQFDTSDIRSSKTLEVDAVWSVHSQNLAKLTRENPQLRLGVDCTVSPCFYCFREVGSNSLPCEHAICEPCARSIEFESNLGIATWKKDERFAVVDRCILHLETKHFDKPVYLYTRPPLAGYRVLALDGGGVRGVIELKTLEELHRRLGGKIPIQNFFDLIAGTSTGALVAFGIGVKNWSIENCLEKYRDLCKAAFQSRNFASHAWHGSTYRTNPYEEVLKSAFGDGRLLNTEQALSNGDRQTKVCVTATTGNGDTPCVFTNYLRGYEDTEPSTLAYTYEMRHDHNQKFEIWEVARAASAAPGYFDGFCKKEPWTYWDGGLHHNNPAWIASQEAHKLWPSSFARNPDILLSVGSGHTNVAPVDLPLETTKAWYEFWKWQPQSLKAIAVLKNALLQAIDSERQWEQQFHGLVVKEGRHYDRLNPVLRCKPVPELDDTSALADGKLDNEADLFLQSPSTRNHLNRVVKRLIASSFYFCPSRSFEEDASGEITIQGSVKCRFMKTDRTDDYANFCDLLLEFMTPRQRTFKFTSFQPARDLAECDVTELSRMQQDGNMQFDCAKLVVDRSVTDFVINLEFPSSNEDLCFVSPISGCPFPLRQTSSHATDAMNQELATLRI